ncbi:MAG: MaoC/PaaZ C-terminal domain-containing protein [Gammaproteobacteria bacterium]
MAEALRYASVEIGDALPSLVCPPVTRVMLALYCGASGDHNPLHVDSDFARDAGLGDVIAHGMLVMAWMSRTLTAQVPQAAIRVFTTRFHAMTRVGDVVTCTAKILEKTIDDDEPRVRVAVEARDQRGELKAAGDALIALPA